MNLCGKISFGDLLSQANNKYENNIYTVSVPKHLEFYIDYEKVARDRDMSGDIFTIETAQTQVHVFSNH